MDTDIDKKRKMKRDYMIGYRKKNKLINVSFSQDDLTKITKNAMITGLSITEFIRDSSLKKHIQPIDPNEKYRLEFKIEIRRIGKNLNQIAKALSNRYQMEDVNKVKDELEEITANLKNLLQLLK